jgi:hypothetical protein
MKKGCLERIKKDLAECKRYLAREDALDESVSHWTLYKQIEHILAVNRKILKLIVTEDEWTSEPESKTLRGHIILPLGLIPRGKAKAPKSVHPSGLSQEELKELAAEVDSYLKQVEEIANNGKLPKQIIGNHPYFGGLSGSDWMRMIEIHQIHHLKIVKDIVR